jgi:6-phosphofructokinase 1
VYILGSGLLPNLTISAFRVHRAGPRKMIYYEPSGVKAAIVTCGGLCPGLNDVIRQVGSFLYLPLPNFSYRSEYSYLKCNVLFLKIVFTLEKYGVKNIVGIPFGYRGFTEKGLSEIPVSSSLYQ